MLYAMNLRAPITGMLPSDIQELINKLPAGTFLGGSTALNIALFVLDVIDQDMLHASFEEKKFDFFRFMINFNTLGILPAEAFQEKEKFDEDILSITKRMAFKPTVFIQSSSERFNMSWEGFDVHYFLKSSMNVLIDFHHNVILFKDEACFNHTRSCMIYFPHLKALINEFKDILKNPLALSSRRAFLEREINGYLKYASKQRMLGADFSAHDLEALAILFQEGGKELYNEVNKLFYDFSCRKINAAPAFNENFLKDMLYMSDQDNINDDIDASVGNKAVVVDGGPVLDSGVEHEKALIEEKQQFWSTLYDETYANNGEFYTREVAADKKTVERKMNEKELEEFWSEAFNRAQEMFRKEKMNQSKGYQIIYPYSVLTDETENLSIASSETRQKRTKFAFKSVVLKKSANVAETQDDDNDVSCEVVDDIAVTHVFSGYPKSRNRGSKPLYMKRFIQKLQKQKESIPVVYARQRTRLEAFFKDVATSNKGWGAADNWVIDRMRFLNLEPELLKEIGKDGEKLRKAHFESLYNRHISTYQSILTKRSKDLVSKQNAENATMRLYMAGAFLILISACAAIQSDDNDDIWKVTSALCIMIAAFIKFFCDANASHYLHETNIYECMLNDLLKTFNDRFNAKHDKNSYHKLQYATLTEILMVMQQLKFRNYDFSRLDDNQYPKALKSFLLNFISVVRPSIDSMYSFNRLLYTSLAKVAVTRTIESMMHLIAIHGEFLLDMMLDNTVPEIRIPMMDIKAQMSFMESCIDSLNKIMQPEHQQMTTADQKDAMAYMDLIFLIYMHRKSVPAEDNVMKRFASEHREVAQHLDVIFLANLHQSPIVHTSKAFTMRLAKDGANSDFSVLLLKSLYALGQTASPVKPDQENANSKVLRRR